MKKLKFSLIEILVVVAIIGILASFLMPTLKNARESARRATCINNEKQMGIAFAMYHGDNDGYFPIYDNGNGNNHSSGYLQPLVSWDDQLGIYDGRNLTEDQQLRDNFRHSDDDYNDDLYTCPSQIQERNPAVLKSYQINGDYYNQASNPSRNVQGTSGWSNTGGSGASRYYSAWSTNVAEVGNTGEAIVLSEFHSFDNVLGLAGTIRGGIISKNFSPSGFVDVHSNQVGMSGFYVHDNSSFKQNFLMADGSVKYITTATTYGDQANAYYSGTHLSSANLQGTYWDLLQ